MSKALVPLAQGCEELEAVTITDLLTRAGIEVTTAGLDEQPVVASRGMKLLPDTTINKVVNNTYDIIVLPGGLPGADHLSKNPHVQQLLKKHASEKKLVAAICAAPKALASAGLLDNKTVTCYPGSLSSSSLNNTTINTTSIEVDGNIVTSRGPGTAMDFALKLIELLEGPEKSEEINSQLVR
ncbi:MAG: DJ-1/PfpI family protein [Gammaproteobacteria bacterium]|nr:DJ-1/PfpI family protein [Gammaproteobacteria bacterium]MCW8910500.1 DJ-1/PfpI family protein [Gammaproteobacteria bacterium]MCW9004678.1 DJ-1/PfpI family protein [Gammaproteobacteria bacterium]MCW9055656.1 DJ-1/PfpI family protein [Gammaproteobacteria bacterium]